MVSISRPLVDKIRKYGVEEFCGKVEDDLEKVEFWLENTIRVFKKLSYPSSDCLKCAIALLKDEAYQWWNTLIVVRYLDKKWQEFLELKLGRIKLGPSRLTYKVEEEEVEGIM
ncbi:hypothetical protein Goshw_029374, partial [Gossypium schwendimanii]|nr:hypothetical protein [Gossypium schwendimanii]